MYKIYEKRVRVDLSRKSRQKGEINKMERTKYTDINGKLRNKSLRKKIRTRTKR